MARYFRPCFSARHTPARRLFPWLAALSVALGWRASHAGDLQVVGNLDPARYAGKWYEVARLPNFFERKCVADTTATYTPRPDGRFTVLNECRVADGSLASSSGIAKGTPGEPDTKLRVSFFRPFWADYWVIDLDPQYRWAVVGEPGRRYLWVLSRTATLEAATLEQILARSRGQGYDLSKLRIAGRP